MLALVVDDSPTLRSMVKASLEQIGFDVATAQDGKRALKIMGAKKMDIIITDINMPNMDGYELIKELRHIDNAKHIPILVLTTEAGSNAKQQGKEAGATGWVLKPFQPEVMQKAVKKVCQMDN